MTTLNNSNLFKQAHTLAKQVHVNGDNYKVTFGQCLLKVKNTKQPVLKLNMTYFK